MQLLRATCLLAFTLGIGVVLSACSPSPSTTGQVAERVIPERLSELISAQLEMRTADIGVVANAETGEASVRMSLEETPTSTAVFRALAVLQENGYDATGSVAVSVLQADGTTRLRAFTWDPDGNLVEQSGRERRPGDSYAELRTVGVVRAVTAERIRSIASGEEPVPTTSPSTE